MRERLHSYTKRTLGAGGSYNDAVRGSIDIILLLSCVTMMYHRVIESDLFLASLHLIICRWLFHLENLALRGWRFMLSTFTMMSAQFGL